jgi:hypothetical protein
MKNRSVIEVMVIVFTFVVAFFIVGLGLIIIWVEVKSPESDTGVLANTLGTLVSGLLGALLGLIAGKGSSGTLGDRPSDKDGKPPP